MPLSKPSPRRLLHGRDIVCHGFQRDDGLWDIEGQLIDRKTYSFGNHDRDGISAGEPIHHMFIRLTLDDDMVVRAAEAATDAGPFSLCGEITGVFEKLVGLTVGPGWRRRVLAVMGGVEGCTHLTDLVSGPLAVTAFQTIYAARERRSEPSAGKRPPLIDTCHAFRADGPVVERQWPDFFEGNERS